MWSFYCYDDGKPDNLWERWFLQQDDAVQAAHDQCIDILIKMPIWKGPHICAISNYKSLVEIRLQGRKKWRLVGYYAPKGMQRVFTILIVCNHKQRVYVPPKAFDTAERRMNEIEQGSAKAVYCARPKSI